MREDWKGVERLPEVLKARGRESGQDVGEVKLTSWESTRIWELTR